MTNNSSDDNKDRDTTNKEKNFKPMEADKQKENRTITRTEYQARRPYPLGHGGRSEARRETDTSCDIAVGNDKITRLHADETHRHFSRQPQIVLLHRASCCRK